MQFAKYIALLQIMLFTQLSMAQRKLSLPEFELIDSTHQGLEASYALRFEALQRAQPILRDGLVDLLKRQTPIHLKHYGPGLVATPTYRGGDANHTQVLWNGFPINSPMLGTMDLNTLPVNQFNSVSLLGGNASNMFSSGGLGGSIALEQAPSYAHAYNDMYSGIGSFETAMAGNQTNLPFQIGNLPAVFNFTSGFTQSSNHFPFIDISAEDQPKRNLQNAAFNRSNVSTQFGLAPTNKTRIQAIYWYNHMDRSIPAPINTASATSEQYDEAHRAMLQGAWKPNEASNVELSSFYEFNSNRFIDTSIQIDNDNRYHQFQQQARFAYNKEKLPRLEGKIRYQFIRAQSMNYNEQQDAHGISAVIKAGYRIWKERIQLEGGYRYERFFEDDAFLPFGGIRIKHDAKSALALFASASETVRFPTMNERFWIPGGNLKLNPERASNLEAGLQFERNQKKAALSYYHIDYTDRIRWLPYGTLFTPSNVNQAQTDGVEASVQWTVQWAKHFLRLHFNATRLMAIGRIDEDAPWQQLSFIPRQSVNYWLSYEHGQWSLRYAGQFMDRRYISNDEGAYMPSFFIQDIGVQYHHLIQDYKWAWSIGIENFMDWNHQVMPWRPMPGRAITIQLRVSWEE